MGEIEKGSSLQPSHTEAPDLNVPEIVNSWATDIVKNIQALRETSNYNVFRGAVDDLIRKLK